MATSSHVIMLRPFDGKTDFSIWQKKMKCILIQQKVFKAIDHSYASTETLEKKSEMNELEKKSKIGRDILKIFHGLPLAIKVVGGVLVNQEESKRGWGSVLKQMEKYHMETDVLKILELSYQNLPSHLKQRLLCLAFFKEDEVIQVRRLVQTWVGLGLVQTGEGCVEKTTRDYLVELINRNLIQVKSMSMDDRVKYCTVHDHLHGLSMRKATEEIGFKSLRNENEQGSSSSYKPRHCVVLGSAERIESSNQGKYLRSLFLQVVDVHFTTLSYWKNFKLLRILDIEGSLFSELPSKVRGLIGIRLLRLRQKKGGLMLPRWLDDLINLEVLDIDCTADCTARVEFPDVTWNMDNLRHLYLNCLDCIEFSDSMKKSSWKNMETLKYMRANNVLRGFSSHLRKLGVEMEEVDGGEAEFERFLVESQVQELHIKQWLFDVDKFLSIPTSPHLTKLKLNGFLLGCPRADNFPQNITHLTFTHSVFFRSDTIQEAGKLPKLLFLKLDSAFHSTMSTIKVSREGFHRLKVLHVRNKRYLQNIEIEEGGMPNLQTQEYS